MESSDSNVSEVISNYDSDADQEDNYQDTQILRAGNLIIQTLNLI